VNTSQLSRLSDLLLSTEQASELEIRGATAAAVLVPLYEDKGTFHLVLTERNKDLPRHPGEISFPGGRHDPGDESLLFTALREAQEEIGLPPESVQIVGALPPTSTIASGYAIYSFVGLITANPGWLPSTSEVAAVIELPLSAVASGYGRRRLSRRGAQIRADTYVVNGHVIWGATARIVSDLLDRLDRVADGLTS